MGEPAIIPASLVTLVVKLKLLSPAQARNEPTLAADVFEPEATENEGEEKKLWWKDTGDKGAKQVHAPYFPAIKKNATWWVMMGDSKAGRLITLSKADFTNEKTVIIINLSLHFGLTLIGQDSVPSSTKPGTMDFPSYY